MKSFLTTLLLVTLTFNIISLTYARNLQVSSEEEMVMAEEMEEQEEQVIFFDLGNGEGEEEEEEEGEEEEEEDTTTGNGEGEEEEQDEGEGGEQNKGDIKTQISTSSTTKGSTDGYQIAAFVVVMIPLALISSI